MNNYTKKCCSCNEVKPASEFHRLKKANDGLQTSCKVCTLKRHAEYRSRTSCGWWKNKEGQPYLVYTFTNPVGQVYVGITGTTAKLRYQRHRASHVKRVDEIPELFNSFDNYGFDNHKFEVIEKYETKLLALQAETKLIIKNTMANIAINKNISSIRIGQYTMQGELVKEWDCITEAAKSLGKKSSSIYAALRYYKTSRSAYGYKWKALPFNDGSIYDMKTNTLIEATN